MTEYTTLGNLISPAKVVRCGNGSYPVLSMTMHDGIVLQSDRFKKSLASADQSDYKVVKYGQLVVGFPIDEGVLYIQKATNEGIMSPAYNVWDVDVSKVEADYLELCLHSPQAMQYYCDKLRGSTARRRSIPTADLLALPIRLPTLEEQREKLEMMAKMNVLIEDREQQLDLADQLVKSRFIEMFGDVIFNEKKWNVTFLNDITDVRDGTHDSPEYHAEGYPFVTSKNITQEGIDFSTCSLICEKDYLHFNERSCVDDGDILMPMIGTIGGATIVKKDRDFAIKNVALIKFNKDNSIIDRRFILYILNSDSMNAYFDSLKTGGTQKFIGLGQIRKIPIILPPIELQNEFAEFVKLIDKSKYHGEFAFKKEVAA